MASEKTCTKCGETKPLDGFHRNKGKVDGRNPHCKECVLEYGRRYYKENRDKVRERDRRYYEENRDELREYARRYYEENRDNRLEKQRQYREENRDKVRERDRRYYEENRDKVLDRDRRYREENRDELRERNRRYYEENRNKKIDYARRYHKENRDFINQGRKIRDAQRTRTSNLLASKKGTPYSPDEDALLLANNGMTVYQKAITLGRTYKSCIRRLERLSARESVDV